MVEDWAERSCEANDRCLQELFRAVPGPVNKLVFGPTPLEPHVGGRLPLGMSHQHPARRLIAHHRPDHASQVLDTSAQLPPEQRLVMYDACDEGEAARAPLGPLRKRLDWRRNTKPKKAAVQLQAGRPVSKRPLSIECHSSAFAPICDRPAWLYWLRQARAEACLSSSGRHEELRHLSGPAPAAPAMPESDGLSRRPSPVLDRCARRSTRPASTSARSATRASGCCACASPEESTSSLPTSSRSSPRTCCSSRRTRRRS